MTVDCRRLFVLFAGGWLLAAVGLLGLVEARPETYFVVGFAGLLVAMQVAAPRAGRPTWWRTVRRVQLVGFMVFLYVISGRILPLNV